MLLYMEQHLVPQNSLARSLSRRRRKEEEEEEEEEEEGRKEWNGMGQDA